MDFWSKYGHLEKCVFVVIRRVDSLVFLTHAKLLVFFFFSCGMVIKWHLAMEKKRFSLQDDTILDRSWFEHYIRPFYSHPWSHFDSGDLARFSSNQ